MTDSFAKRARVMKKKKHPQTRHKGLVSKRFASSLRYSDIFSVNSTGGAPNRKIFNLNSLYDPDNSLGGHQPLGYDQLMALYDKYTVLEARVRVRFFNQTASLTNMAVAGVSIGNTTGSGGLNLSFLSEQDGTITKPLLSSGNGNFQEIITRIDIAKHFGVTRGNLRDEPDYSGATLANPVLMPFLSVWVAPADGVTSLNDVLVQVDLEFISEFHSLKGYTVQS